jgi:hypothetical protein
MPEGGNAARWTTRPHAALPSRPVGFLCRLGSTGTYGRTTPADSCIAAGPHGPHEERSAAVEQPLQYGMVATPGDQNAPNSAEPFFRNRAGPTLHVGWAGWVRRLSDRSKPQGI